MPKKVLALKQFAIEGDMSSDSVMLTMMSK